MNISLKKENIENIKKKCMNKLKNVKLRKNCNNDVNTVIQKIKNKRNQVNIKE